MRERIAAAVYGDGWENAYPEDKDYWLTVADSVIAELRLAVEWGSLTEGDEGVLGENRDEVSGYSGEIKYRYITEWETDD